MIQRVFNGLRVEKLELLNPRAVFEHIRGNFNREEPTLRSKLAHPDFFETGQLELDNEYLEAVKEKTSFAAVDGDGKIAGIIISGWIHKNDPPKIYRHPQSMMVQRLFQREYDKADFFNRFGVDRIFDFKILSVDPKYRKKGIGRTLFGITEELARDSGAKVLRGDCTSAFSRAIHEHFGWEIFSETKFEDYRDEQGNVLIKSEPPHDSYQLRYKILP